MKLPEPYADRVFALRKEIKKAGLSAVILSRPENRRYLSGYGAADSQLDESSGLVLITSRQTYVLTDFRYKIQAEREARGFTIMIYEGGPAESVGRLANRLSLTRIGYEEDFLTIKNHRLQKKQLQGVGFISAAGMVEKQRIIKSSAEIKLITRSLRLTEKALGLTLEMLRPGVSEIETARFLTRTMMDLGAEDVAFPAIVASGPNAALPHAEPGGRKIKEGETIVIDCGAKLKGYCSDMTRTLVLGRPKPWIKTVYGLVRQAQLTAVKNIKPGMGADQADGLARRIIAQAGYGPNFGHSLGHGVGLATHESPSLSRLRPVRLQPGMVVTIEPGIYIEGRGGVRLEEMAVITPEGCRILNRDKHFYQWD